MAKKKIVRVTIISGHGLAACKVGTGRVAKITESSQEFEDGIHSQYDAYDENGDIVRTIENCPVDVVYVDA